MRRFLHRIADTVHYLKLWRATVPAARYIPASMLAKAPICWVRGHSWEKQPSFGITSWCAEFCTCCGQEIAYRTSLDQLRAPETDDERDEADWDREQRFSRADDEYPPDDDYRDELGAPYDWDSMRDEAVANGGPF